MLARLLSGYANNPNVAGVSVLSLGCQNLQVELFLDECTVSSDSVSTAESEGDTAQARRRARTIRAARRAGGHGACARGAGRDRAAGLCGDDREEQGRSRRADPFAALEQP